MNISVLQGRTKAVDEGGFLSPRIMQWINTVLVPAVNSTTPLTIPGPFADDAAAAAGEVAIGSLYYVSNTQVNVRLI